MSQASFDEITYQVLRYNPETKNKPKMQEYKVPYTKGLTVLDGLLWIKEHVDPTLAWRSSCRMGVCGSCAMFINGLPRLACTNQIAHLDSNVIVVKPLPNYDIIKDLVPDFEDFFEKHRTIKPFVIRDDMEELNNPTGEFFQSQDELVNYIQFAYCIKCGACLAACPTVATDDKFLGPQALSQAWRYIADSRDEGEKERDIVYSPHGAFNCHFAGACSDVCPKGVDPGFAIQALKQDMFLKTIGGRKCEHGADVLPEYTEHVPNEKIPAAPEKTVK